MIKPIVKDPMFLSQKAEPALPEDVLVGQDLRDTLNYHASNCVGMAANMIGVCKDIIAVQAGKTPIVMYNPKIIKQEKPYKTEEGCLCHEHAHQTTRYEKIKVEYEDEKFKKVRKSFSGFTAQIIQHEIDHCNGILI
jgi:peptide deformylase